MWSILIWASNCVCVKFTATAEVMAAFSRAGFQPLTSSGRADTVSHASTWHRCLLLPGLPALLPWSHLWVPLTHTLAVKVCRELMCPAVQEGQCSSLDFLHPAVFAAFSWAPWLWLLTLGAALWAAQWSLSAVKLSVWGPCFLVLGTPGFAAFCKCPYCCEQEYTSSFSWLYYRRYFEIHFLEWYFCLDRSLKFHTVSWWTEDLSNVVCGFKHYEMLLGHESTTCVPVKQHVPWHVMKYFIGIRSKLTWLWKAHLNG